MNKELYNKSWDFPKDLQNHMRICFGKVKNADANTEGYNRNRRLQTATSISYPELKIFLITTQEHHKTHHLF